MRKLFVFLAVLTTMTLAPLSALASGKLTVGANYFTDVAPGGLNNALTPTAGLSIYETVAPKLAVNSWTGLGESPFNFDKPSARWYVSKLDLDYALAPRLTASVGFTFAYVMPYAVTNNNVHAKLAVALW